MAKSNLKNYTSGDGFGAPLNMRRGNPNPLDNSELFESLEDAQNYASNSPIAYVGQLITTVIEDTDGNITNTTYRIEDEAGTLNKITTSADIGDISGGINPATTEEYGIVKIDGETIIINKDGQLEATSIGLDGEPAYISVSKVGRISTVVAEDSLHGRTTVQITDGKNGETPIITISDHGTWVINGVDTNQVTKEKGDPGTGFQISNKYNSRAEMLAATDSTEDSTMVICLENNSIYIRLDGYNEDETVPGWMGLGSINVSDIKGEKGDQGEPGLSPTINPNNNHWMIGALDTGIIAEGQPGSTPTIDPNSKHWIVDHVDTGIVALGITPHIDETTKHWIIGTTDTNVIAEGQAGVTPHIDPDTKHWMIGTTDTGIVAEARDFVTVEIDPNTNHWLLDGVDSGISAVGVKGDNGVSPTISVNKVDNKAIITITDANGTTTAELFDGEDGADGAVGIKGDDGISPTISVDKTDNKATITITDINGTKTVDIFDGEGSYDDTDLQTRMSAVETIVDNIPSDIGDKVDYQQGAANAGKILRVNNAGRLEISEDGGGTIANIKVNNVDQPITNKTVSLSIPTKTSDLTNDSNYVVNTTVASNSTLGLVKVDGTTVTIDANGVIHSESGKGTPSATDGNILEEKDDGLYVPPVDFTGYALESQIPTKTSDLTNDGSDGTSTYVEAADLPTKLSDFNNDIIATTERAGTVKPDGSTVTIDANGVITSLIGYNSVSYKPGNLIQLLLNSDHNDDPDWDHTWEGIYVDADQTVPIGTYDEEGKLKPDGASIVLVNPDDEHDGTIKVSDDFNKVQYSTTPQPDENNLGKIIQYVGETNSEFTNGQFYRRIDSSKTVYDSFANTSRTYIAELEQTVSITPLSNINWMSVNNTYVSNTESVHLNKGDRLEINSNQISRQINVTYYVKKYWEPVNFNFNVENVSDINDVNINGITTGQTIVYDTSTEKWTPGFSIPDPTASNVILKANSSLEWEEYNINNKQDKEWIGTTAEYEAAANTIPDGTIVHITDDDGNMVGARTTEIYSTSEMEIGRWIDGKPLYRKVITATISSSKTQQIAHNISNVGMIMAKEWYLHNGTIWQNQAYAYPYAAGFTADVTNVRIEKDSASTWSGAESIFIIEYTKTTD